MLFESELLLFAVNGIIYSSPCLQFSMSIVLHVYKPQVYILKVVIKVYFSKQARRRFWRMRTRPACRQAWHPCSRDMLNL